MWQSVLVFCLTTKMLRKIYESNRKVIRQLTAKPLGKRAWGSPQKWGMTVNPTWSPSPDGRLLASEGSYDRTVQVWEARTGQLVQRYQGHGRNMDDALVDFGKSTVLGALGNLIWAKAVPDLDERLQPLFGH